MRGLAGALLFGLLLLPACQAISVGPAQTLSEFPAQLSPPARGKGFTAWIDVREGIPQVLLRRDGGQTVRLVEDPPNAALQHLTAAGDWIAWSQQDTAGVLPGEQAGRSNWDVLVYHVPRAAIVYDSASARSNETNPALSQGRVAFLDDASGVRQVHVAALSGPDAFHAQAVWPTGLAQGPPALDGDTVVFLQQGEDGAGDLLRVQAGAATTLATAGPGLGLGPPSAWRRRVAWPEHRGRDSELVLWSEDGVTRLNWTGGTVQQGLGDGELYVAEVRHAQRGIWVWCEGEQPTRLASGVQSRPAVGDGAVAYLVQVGAEQHVQMREVSCGAPQAARGRGVPSLPTPGILVALAVAAVALGRRTG